MRKSLKFLLIFVLLASSLFAIRSYVAQKYIRENLTGVSLDVTLDGNGTVTATFMPDQIIADLSLVQDSNNVTIETPVSMEIMDAYIVADSDSGGTLTIKNSTDAIESFAHGNTDNAIVRADSWDDTYTTFYRGNDDLILYVTGGDTTFSGTLVIDLVPL